MTQSIATPVFASTPLTQATYGWLLRELSSFASRTNVEFVAGGVHVTLTRRQSPYKSHQGIAFRDCPELRQWEGMWVPFRHPLEGVYIPLHGHDTGAAPPAVFQGPGVQDSFLARVPSCLLTPVLATVREAGLRWAHPAQATLQIAGYRRIFTGVGRDGRPRFADEGPEAPADDLLDWVAANPDFAVTVADAGNVCAAGLDAFRATADLRDCVAAPAIVVARHLDHPEFGQRVRDALVTAKRRFDFAGQGGY